MEARKGLGQGGGQPEDNNKKEAAESEREIRYEKKENKKLCGKEDKKELLYNNGIATFTGLRST